MRQFGNTRILTWPGATETSRGAFIGSRNAARRARDYRGNDASIDVEADGETVVLSVGAAGGRSLYTGRTTTSWVAGTSHGLVAAALDATERFTDALAGTMLFVGSKGRGLIRGIERVPSFGVWTIRNQGVLHTMRDVPDWDEHEGTEGELAQALWEKIVETVRRRVLGFDNVCVMAGGGVDSSGLLAAALDSRVDFRHLSLDFGGRGDDRPYLRMLERAFGTTPTRMSPRECAPYARKSLVVSGAPYTLLSGAFDLALFHTASARGRTALLTGMGGDEVLAGVLPSALLASEKGDPKLRFGALARATRLRLPWEASQTSIIMNYVIRPSVRTKVPRRLRKALILKHAKRNTPWLGVSALRHLDAHADELTLRVTDVPASPRERYMYFARNTLFDEYADLRALLEESCPGVSREDLYLDDELIEFISRIPPRFLTSGNRHRGLFLRALNSRVPTEIGRRSNKAYFEEAILDVLDASDIRPFLLELAEARCLGERDLVNRLAFREQARNAIASIDPQDQRLSYLWQALAVEAYLQELS